MTSDLNNLLLRRGHQLMVPPSLGASAGNGKVATQLEAELAGLGYVLAADLREALAGLDRKTLTNLSRSTLQTLAEQRGAHVYHVTQFRQFPRSTPDDTVALYIDRVLSWLFQAPDAPCVLCGSVGSVNAVNPCGHLVCSACFDGADYSGCPICHQRIDLDDPFLKPAPVRGDLPVEQHGPLIRLVLGGDSRVAAQQIASQLLARQSALSPADRADLLVLVDVLGDDIISLAAWAGGIRVRETKALVYGTLLAKSDDPAATFAQFAPALDTATDILRVLNVFLGADAALVEPRPRLRTIARPFRRAVLSRLEQLPLERLGEDLGRHDGYWLRLGQMLRPFEFHKQFPQTATAFAALRRTPLNDDRYGKLETTVVAAADDVTATPAGTLVMTKQTVKLRSFASQVEEALAKRDLVRAVQLLEQRPGEFARRLDHLLRLCTDDHLTFLVIHTFDALLPKLPAPLLLTVRSAIRRRSQVQGRRVFFPRGAITRPYGMADQRQPLEKEIADRVSDTITDELVRRARNLPKVTTAVLDEALQDLLVPTAERTTSKSLVMVPRGSQIPLPSDDERLRLFLHWTEPEGLRIDLDLSVAFFDADWRMVGLCDYTRLRAFNGKHREAAVHSGDLTSAPAPLGASEFVDLNLPLLREAGARHAAMIVFSYNDVAFDRMEDAFAGFMRGRDQRGEIFDARTVEQRFDLVGDAKICLPLLIDLEEKTMLWIDMHPSSSSGFQAIWRHAGKLSHLCCDLHDNFTAGNRPTLYDAAAMQAAGCAAEIQVRGRDGKVRLFKQRGGEHPVSFVERLVTAQDADGELARLSVNGEPVFAALVNGDVALPAGSSVYTLRQLLTPEQTVTQLAASDLTAAFVS